jgi:hypothetical protein
MNMHVQHSHTLDHYGLFMKTSSWGHRARVHRIDIHDATWVLYQLQAGCFFVRVITIRFVHKINTEISQHVELLRHKRARNLSPDFTLTMWFEPIMDSFS